MKTEDAGTLGSDALALLREAADADGPPAGSKDRVRAALAAALAAGAVGAVASASATTAAGTVASSAAGTGAAGGGGALASGASVTAGVAAASTAATTGATLAGASLFAKVAAIAVTISAVGGVALVGTGALDSPPPAPRTAPAVVAAAPVDDLVVEPAALPPSAAEAPEVAAVVAEPALESTEVPVAVPPHDRVRATAGLELAVAPAPEAVPPSTLDEENRLLGEGTRALRAGDGATALARADEIARRFPSRAEDAAFLRIRALCSLGRTADAEHERDAFLAAHPSSPFAVRVRALCGTP